MIYSICHKGSGLGNQLFRYVAGKTLALDKGFDYNYIAYDNFKGASFMNLGDIGAKIPHHIELPSGKVVADVDIPMWEEGTEYYNPEFNFVEDGTIIDGEFQDERYYGHRLGEIDTWLGVEPLEMDDNLCVIGFRGGEYAIYPELFLPMKYWLDSVEQVKRDFNPDMQFRVVTDDPLLAKQIFPFPVSHEIGHDWRSVRYAKYAIIANSSFFILPRLLNGGVTIAPRFWARRNIGKWSLPQNYYKQFIYV